MKLATGCIFYTKERRDFAVSHGFPPARAFVAQNTVCTDEVFQVKSQISEETLSGFITEHRLEGKKILLYIGRLQRRKKPDLLLEVLPSIREHIPNIHLTMIGHGEMEEPLRALIASKNLSEDVSMPGAIFEEESLAPYLLSASLVVMPSAAGLTIQHVFSYGLPVVLGDDMKSHGPEIELIHDNTGRYFKASDPESLADTVVALLQNEEKLASMKQDCLKLMEEQYTVDNMVKGFVEAVGEIG